MNLSRGLCWLNNTASEQHLNTIIEATVVISILSVWTQRYSAICLANACDFGHTSLLNFRLDWHPIAQGPIFQAAKSVGWTYRSCLKLESHRCTLRPKLRGKKFCLRLVHRENSGRWDFFFPNAFERWGIDGRCEIVQPVKDFFCHPIDSVWFGDKNSPVKQKEWDIELPIDSDNPNVGNLCPNSAPALRKFALSVIISLA
jgi:hypothetical protein